MYDTMYVTVPGNFDYETWVMLGFGRARLT